MRIASQEPAPQPPRQAPGHAGAAPAPRARALAAAPPSPRSEQPPDALGALLARSVARRVLARVATPTLLYAFGNAKGPSPPRPVSDYDTDPGDGTKVVAQSRPTPKGKSTFSDVTNAPVTGIYHSLPAATELPAGLDVIADGSDVGGTHSPYHHTIFPTQSMLVDTFKAGIANLAWTRAGKK